MTAIDTNVVIGLLSEDDAFNVLAKRALQRAAAKGSLVLSPPVYIELCAMPKRDNFHLETFLRRAHILVDWMLEEAIWRAAGAANAQYVERRRANRQTPRRIAADFLIGAHAMLRDAELLTFDKRTFKTYFPNVKIVEP
jgi:predicted nucleic acid-binding protein